MLAGDVSSIRQLDQAIVRRVTGGTVVRVKLWAPAKLGRFRIVYSDDHRLSAPSTSSKPRSSRRCAAIASTPT